MSLIFNVYIVNYLYFTEINLLLVQYARLVKFKRLFWGFIGRILVWLGSTWFILYSICLKSFFVNLTFNGKCTWTKTLNMHYFVRTLMCRNKKISWKIHRKKRKVTLIILCIWHHRTALRAPVWRHHTQWPWPTRYLMTLKYLNIMCKFSWF